MISLIFAVSIFSPLAHAQFDTTTYIGIEKKSKTSYKWKDQSGNTVYSDAPPPETCKTPSCNAIREAIEEKVMAENCKYKSFKWREESGKQACANTKPPESCKTQSCNALRRYKWRDESGHLVYSDLQPPDNCKTPSCQEVRDSISRERQELQRSYRRETHLSEGEIVCTSASHIQILNSNQHTLDALISRGSCQRLSNEIRYQVASRKYDFCNCIQVILPNVSGSPMVWVRSFSIPVENWVKK